MNYLIKSFEFVVYFLYHLILLFLIIYMYFIAITQKELILVSLAYIFIMSLRVKKLKTHSLISI